MASLLLYGYGNPGRRDDGLGVAFAERIQSRGLEGITVETNYQLNAEDALEASHHDIVLFADASRTVTDDFRLSRLMPEGEVSFTTHAMSPGSVLALCRELYDRRPEAYLLELRGHQWDMAEELSPEGIGVLDKTVSFMEPLLRTGDFRALRAAAAEPNEVGRE
mgnify:CR=1 FL=1